MKRYLIVAATDFEILPLTNYLKQHFEQKSAHWFELNNTSVWLLVTGVGLTNTAYHLAKILDNRLFDMVINVGIAGSFEKDIPLGSLVEVVTEQFGDLGVENNDGQFMDMFELELIDGNEPPFENNILKNNDCYFPSLPKANGLTVNKVHGFQSSINAIRAKYHTQIESMEGAAFFQCCLLGNIPFAQIRAISNYVEPRNRDNWKLPEAIGQLNDFLIQMFENRWNVNPKLPKA